MSNVLRLTLSTLTGEREGAEDAPRVRLTATTPSRLNECARGEDN